MNVDYRHQQANWSAHLCGCGDDLCTCLITCCLPCVTFGQISEILDEGQSSCITQGFVYGMLYLCACNCLLSCVYRGKLRNKFGLQGDSCGDCCIHFCCEPCALCQEHCELKNRGLDPSKGWIGPPTAPPVPQMPPSMYR